MIDTAFRKLVRKAAADLEARQRLISLKEKGRTVREEFTGYTYPDGFQPEPADPSRVGMEGEELSPEELIAQFQDVKSTGRVYRTDVDDVQEMDDVEWL